MKKKVSSSSDYEVINTKQIVSIQKKYYVMCFGKLIEISRTEAIRVENHLKVIVK